MGIGVLTGLLCLAPRHSLFAYLPAPSAKSTAAPSSIDTWLQTLSSLLSPSLTAAIRQGRERAYTHGNVMPESIRQALAPFFPRAVLQKVRYSTSWQDAAAEGALYTVLLGTGADAVTLGDVIIFRDAQRAADPVLWAHELTHVEQYDRLGVEMFAARYLQQGWVLEQEAIEKANTIKKQISP